MLGLNGSHNPAEQPAAGSAGSVAAQYVDLHCHVLPGIDDGPLDLAASLELCVALVEDGVTTVVATPHELGRYEGSNTPPQIRKAVSELNVELGARNIPLHVLPGADVRIHERLIQLIDSDGVMTLADKGKHILLELPHETLIDLTHINRALIARGVQPILTHPERHHALRRRPELLARWVDDGMLVQVTAGSLIGLFGPNSQENAWDLVGAGLVHIVATDAHDHEQRPPVFTEAHQALKEHAGDAMADQLCKEIPLRVLAGEALKLGRLTVGGAARASLGQRTAR